MAQLLKQSTAATLVIGPAVDKTDGFTEETGLGAGTVDAIGVYKHGATAITDLSATTTFTHRNDGMYTLTLSTSNTDTLGHLVLYIADESVCRPIRQEYLVVPANVYDSIVGGSDKLQVDTTQWAGQTTTLSTGNLPDVNIAEISDDATAADNLESYTDGGSKMPVDAVQISSSATAADNLESYVTGGDNLPVHVQEYTSSFDFSSTMKTSIQTACTASLNAAIPGSPTSNSVFERIKSMDELTESGGSGDLAAILTDTGTDGVQIDMDQVLVAAASITADSVGAALKYSWATAKNKIERSGTTLYVYDDDGSTVLIQRTLDSATNATTVTPV